MLRCSQAAVLKMILQFRVIFRPAIQGYRLQTDHLQYNNIPQLDLVISRNVTIKLSCRLGRDSRCNVTATLLKLEVHLE